MASSFVDLSTKLHSVNFRKPLVLNKCMTLSKEGSSLQVFPKKSLYDVRFQPTGMQFLKSCVHFSPITYTLHALLTS